MRSVPLILCIAIGLSGCIFFYPRKIVQNDLAHDDKACEIIHRKLVLDKITIGKASDWFSTGGCYTEDCLAVLLIPVVTAASTFLVSGSIVITGNVAYWLERKGECPHEGSEPAASVGRSDE